MSEFRIFETNEFIKQLAKLSPTDASRIQSKLKSYVYPQLKQDPFRGTNIKKLRGYSPNIWRYRINKFRLFYSVDNSKKIVFILTIDFRKNAYR
ncbi:MAG: type II toxin-antitoxin system RelE/ParE family toxin [FCB group bacterium]|nr:type II toxin-antitoxin system RelE/ParE family toxin [FCB group bacterium]